MEQRHLLAAIVTLAACATEPPPPPSTLFVSDRGASAIVRYDGVTGEYRDTFAASERPSSVRLGPSGDLYLAGFGNGDVTRYAVDTGRTMGVFYWDTELLEEPVELMFLGELLVVLGKDTHNLVLLAPDGRVVKEIYSPDLRSAHDLVLAGDLAYVGTDTHPQLGSTIQVWNLATGALVTQYGAIDQLASATGIALGPDDRLYVADSQRDQVLVLDRETGATLDILVPATSGILKTPISLELGPDGALYVLDATGVHRLNPNTGDQLSLFVDVKDGHLAGPRSFTFLTEDAIDDAIARRR